MRPPRPAAAAAVVALLAILAAPALPGAAGGRALAHAQLVASSPAGGSVLDEPPDEIRLVFSEPLEAELTSFDLADGDGALLLERAGEIDLTDPFVLVAAIPRLDDGVYSVTWRTLSAADGHPASGFFTFGVGNVEDDLPPTPGATADADRDLVAVTGRWLTYLGFMAALGLVIFHRVVVRGAGLPRALSRLIAGGLAASAVGTGVLLVQGALESGDAASYLFASRSGTLLGMRIAVAALGAVGAVILSARLAGPAAAGAGLAGIVVLVVGGHASGLEGPAAMSAGVAHVIGAGVWAGGLVALLLLALRPAVMGPERPTLRQAVPRFSALALTSVGVMGVSGVYSAWAQTGELLPLDTEYGRVLVLKSVAAVVAIGVGAISFLDLGSLVPWLGGLASRLRFELAAVAVVLGLTAMLATTPPLEEPRGVAIEPIPNAFGVVAPDMGMTIGPGRPGVNRVTVTTSGSLATVGGLELGLERLDGGSSTRVPLTLAGMEGMEQMEGMDHVAMADPDGDGTISWYADAILLPADSEWDTTVHIVGDSGDEFGRQRFSFTMDAARVDEGRLTSLVNVGTGVAVLLIVGGALGVGLGLGGMGLPRCDAAASRVALVGSGIVAALLGVVVGASTLLV
jgi:putative copper export protein/methionine-rich copper-binding protein CopC